MLVSTTICLRKHHERRRRSRLIRPAQSSKRLEQKQCELQERGKKESNEKNNQRVLTEL